MKQHSSQVVSHSRSRMRSRCWRGGLTGVALTRRFPYRRRAPARAEPGDEKAEEGGADNVGKIVRRDIHARDGDEQRDG